MNILLFPRAAGREGMPACPFGDCRKNPDACIRVFDLASQIKKKRSEKYR